MINYVLGDSGRLPDLLRQVSLPIVDQVSCQEEVRKEYGESFVLVSNKNNQESILPNFLLRKTKIFFRFFAIKLGHFQAQTIFSHAINTQA